MPLSDLSLVSDALLNLLKLRVGQAWSDYYNGLTPAQIPPTVGYSLQPSDDLVGEQALGLYLYHAVEDARFQNPPPPSSDVPPVRYSPMGLRLYYKLNPHTDTIDEGHMQRVQQLFGFSLKAFHDYPSIDTNTTVTTSLGDMPVFTGDLVGSDNVFRIAYIHLPEDRASQFWSSSTKPVRLAAYYEVSVALLEPEAKRRRSGRVLRYGIQVFVNGAPRLDSSRSAVTFRIPGETVDRKVDLQPGEAPVGGTISFTGTDLDGDITTLVIRKTGWPTAVEVGTDWGVVAGLDSVFAQIGTHSGTQPILPGVYSAAAKVTRNRKMADGTTQAFPQTSNEVPFTVAPVISSPAYNAVATESPVGSNIVTVVGGPFQDPALNAASVQVIVGPEPVPLQTSGAVTAGNFVIVGPTQLQIRFPIAQLNSGDVLPLRVIVNGAENAPRWVRVP